MALTQRGVTHIAIPTDVQEQEEKEVKASPRNVAHHASFTQAEGVRVPEASDVDRAVEILSQGKKIAILAGRGALDAREELLQTADLLGAPIVKALLGKATVPDDHELTTGGIGLLGTRPSQEAFEECDTLLIVGSTFPYVEYYPKPGQARGVQIDRDASRIGLRYPVEVGLVGDAKQTLQLINSRLERKSDRSFLKTTQERKKQWSQLLHDSAEIESDLLLPGRLARDLGERLDENAIVAWDSGHNTGVLARYVPARAGQLFAGSGMMATMGCAVPYAIAAALAFPGRQVVAFTGDGGLSMLLGELATITRYKLPIKVVVMKNNTLGQIKWEQMMFLGNPEYECELQPIDFAGVAEAMGLKGYRAVLAEDCGYVLDQALATSAAALVEVTVDPNEPLLPPKRIEKYVTNMEKALKQGTPGAQQIRHSLGEQPSRTLLQS
jgi:pyruvate dehydrogenase (quinone)